MLGGADRHRADRLHAAQTVDLVGAREVHRGHDRRRRLALERRCGADHPLHAGDLRREDRHVRGCQQRILAARHVAADAVHRDVLVPQHHARQGLDLDVAQRRFLDLREISNLGLREPDVVDVARRHGFHASLDLCFRQTQFGRIPVVEFSRVFAHGFVAALLDVGENTFDGCADLRAVRGILLGGNARLQKTNHFFSSWRIRGTGTLSRSVHIRRL